MTSKFLSQFLDSPLIWNLRKINLFLSRRSHDFSIIMNFSFHSVRIFREMRIFSLLGFIALSHGFKYDQKSDPWRFEIEFENEPTALKFENIDGWFLEDGIKYSLSEGNLQIDRKK